LVGGKPDPVSLRISKRFRAEALMAGAAVYRIEARRARAFAEALRQRGRLVFAEPDRLMAEQAFPSDPLSGSQWWVTPVVAPSLTPPPVSADSPEVAVIEDDQVDLAHPEFAGGSIRSLSAAPADAAHATEVAAVAGSPANGRGIVGIWPGMRVLVVPTTGRRCSDAVVAIRRAVDEGVSVINMSYGLGGYCFAHHVATNQAFGAGVVLVAAGGNDFLDGNLSDSTPAADPHVISVAALNPDYSSADFSNANPTVDVSAPGVSILTATPTAFDDDGTPDGYTVVDGTSFSAPITAAAAAWAVGARGWDRDYGFGAVDMESILGSSAPRSDPLEPNDDIEWIDGTRFRGADDPIWRGGRSRRIGGRLDLFEDPVDVYPVAVPGRTSVGFTVTPRYGDPDLEIYSSAAHTVYSRRGLIVRSVRGGSRRDRVAITNRARSRRRAYVCIFVPTGVRSIDAEYSLSVRRLRR
jgi:hypothetical protein